MAILVHSRGPKGKRRRRRPGAGMTLLEIAVALAIVGVLLGGAVVGFRAVTKSELRGTAGKLAGAIRYSYDRALTTGGYYRLHFNLDEQTYRLETAEGRVVVARDKERAGRGGRGLDQDEEARREVEDEERRSGTTAGLPEELLPPPSPRRPRFEQFKDSTLPIIQLKKVRILDMYTPRQVEPYEKGHAYLHFFPDGHTERAVIHLGEAAGDQDQYTLFVHPLTGRVEVVPGRKEPVSDYEAVDDAGQKKVAR
jgi:general secretion pathway protein H